MGEVEALRERLNATAPDEHAAWRVAKRKREEAQQALQETAPEEWAEYQSALAGQESASRRVFLRTTATTREAETAALERTADAAAQLLAVAPSRWRAYETSLEAESAALAQFREAAPKEVQKIDDAKARFQAAQDALQRAAPAEFDAFLRAWGRTKEPKPEPGRRSSSDVSKDSDERRVAWAAAWQAAKARDWRALATTMVRYGPAGDPLKWAVFIAVMEEARPEIAKALQMDSPGEWAAFRDAERGSLEERRALRHLAEAVPSLRSFIEKDIGAAPALRLLAEKPGSMKARAAFVELVNAVPSMRAAVADGAQATMNRASTARSGLDNADGTGNLVVRDSRPSGWLSRARKRWRILVFRTFHYRRAPAPVLALMRVARPQWAAYEEAFEEHDAAVAAVRKAAPVEFGALFDRVERRAPEVVARAARDGANLFGLATDHDRAGERAARFAPTHREQAVLGDAADRLAGVASAECAIWRLAQTKLEEALDDLRVAAPVEFAEWEAAVTSQLLDHTS